jgi:hypothetical protein
VHAVAGTPPDENDPFMCPWNPATGTPYDRTVTYNIACNPSIPGAEVTTVVQNSTENCA